jgi:hypothetical protein
MDADGRTRTKHLHELENETQKGNAGGALAVLRSGHQVRWHGVECSSTIATKNCKHA